VGQKVPIIVACNRSSVNRPKRLWHPEIVLRCLADYIWSHDKRLPPSLVDNRVVINTPIVHFDDLLCGQRFTRLHLA
jgi:hypothetical protein